jgi:hypothetical protein
MADLGTRSKEGFAQACIAARDSAYFTPLIYSGHGKDLLGSCDDAVSLS